jgi:hypothetical protein
VTFTLTNNNAVFVGANGAKLGNTLQLTGLRMSAVIKGGGIPAFPEASLRIWGMAQADMNALAIVTVQGGKPEYSFNTVTIEANSGNGWNFVFAGQIFNAGPDYDAAPDVCLDVHAITGGYDLLNPAQPTSYPGTVPVATIVENIAAKMSRVFENDGVTGVLTGTYLSGTPGDQLRTVCQHAGISFSLETANLLVISPFGQQRSKLESFTLSPSSGLVGYPKVRGNGYIDVRSLFNPAYRMNGPIAISGSDVVIDPSLPKTLNTLADGNWIIGPLTHTLEALKPNGAWFSDMTLYPVNAAPPP